MQIQNGNTQGIEVAFDWCAVSHDIVQEVSVVPQCTDDSTEASMSRCSVGICLLTDGPVETEHHATALDFAPRPLMAPLPVPFFEQAELNHNTTTVIDLGYRSGVWFRFANVNAVSLVSSLWSFPLCVSSLLHLLLPVISQCIDGSRTGDSSSLLCSY